ncbi:MAG: prepilin-type N-terminal cleavage/methylation domain-containing protein [Deltaproteobacteria bacterium]|nr:prepilin-type N-terminal cleavage/methylation domain-containing protein [Deltaproteobacteria bacterium]
MRWRARGARTSESGFSLFELIVVLMIVAIASGLAAPGIQSGWRNREVRSGTRSLAAVMRGLRERAVRRGVEQELVVDADGQTYRWTGDQQATLPGGAAVTGIRGGWRDQDGGVRVVFYPNGGSSGIALVVGQREGDSLSFAIRVDPLLGTVVIQEATT